MKKTFLKIHLWLSIPVGLIITVICFSGAVLVFENEIKNWCNASLYNVSQVKEKNIPLGQLVEMVSAALPDTVRITSVSVPGNPKKNYTFGMSGMQRSRIYVDQYTGEVKGRSEDAAMGDFFSVVRRLHRWLMDDFKRDGSLSVGKTIVGVTTLIFVFILITGIIIWVPKTLKGLKQNLRVKINKGRYRFWRDLHVAGGIYAALFLLTLALTGLTWSFTWYRNGFYGLFGVEAQAPQTSQNQAAQHPAKQSAEPQNRLPRQGEQNNPRERGNRSNGEQPREGRDAQNQKIVDLSQWQHVLEKLQVQNPGYNTITIQDGRASVALSPTVGNQRASDNYFFDISTGNITEVKLYKDQEKSGKIRGWIYSVHVGSWGGVVTKILTFLAALLGATLPLTGYYIWWKKWRSKRTAAAT